MSSPTQRTLKLMRADGWVCAVVEKYQPRYRGKADEYATQLREIAMADTTTLLASGRLHQVADKIDGCMLSGFGVRQDLYGFGDVFAFTLGDNGMPGRFRIVQACSYGDVSKRRTKIQGIREAGLWLQAGGEIEIIGWRKVKNRWQPRREMVYAVQNSGDLWE